MTTPTPWLAIDIKGFAQTLTDKGIARIALEPVSNALDTASHDIFVVFFQKDGWATLRVVDDDPKGFEDLKDAYTLYAPSTRKSDPTKRGRFGQGEKELIAVCALGGEITIRSTTGTVEFTKEGRTTSRSGTKAGSEIYARFRMNKAEAVEYRALVRSVLVPAGVRFSFESNEGICEIVEPRVPVRTIEGVTLDTVLADEEGNLRRSRRQTTISLYDPINTETPMIYELGIPVVEHDGRWHIDIGQKVPLNRDRDNVTPAYLRALRTAVLEATHDLISRDDANSTWVKDALPNVSPEAARAVFTERFGKKTVVYDPSDKEASKRLQDEGYTIIYGPTLSRDEHDALRRAGVFKPAGQLRPSHIETSADGVPPIPQDKWTPGMKRLAVYTMDLGFELLGFRPTVEMFNIPVGGRRWAATWGGRTISFNLGVLGHRWFNEPDQEKVDALIIHEFAHHGASDHLSEAFSDNCCSLGAKLRSAKTELLVAGLNA